MLSRVRLWRLMRPLARARLIPHRRSPRGVDTVARADALPLASDAPVLDSPHAQAFVASPTAPVPAGAEVVFLLPSSARFAYVPRAGGDAQAHEVVADPFLGGNAFKPLFESRRALAAAISVASMRRVNVGPESERVFVFLRGSGLIFLENGDTFKFEPNTLAFLPAGEPARVWAQSAEDVLAIVLQPAGQREERRTLAGEVAKRRGVQ